MPYKIVFSDTAEKNIATLDKPIKRRIINFLETKVAPDPNILRQPLHGNKRGLWKYRVGNYRIICNIKSRLLTVLIVDIGHRSEVYR
jgi:mRNA interferase RelE/StbE